ncbi:MAG: hypothetical protein KA270_19720 [Saprospiraceae bacterium]|jgi:hypothetical protein|nr:hypothetical protein [Saprospiraceae bacterium]MBP6236669.1 hypothetical protein [Saprospiraceae bacterium]MBP6569414.1 hypothetical protein [Saprospiraceae bacterium]
MKTIDIQQVNTKRNPIMVYDDSLNLKESNRPCQEKIDKANYMLKNNNVFDAVKVIKAKENITQL